MKWRLLRWPNDIGLEPDSLRSKVAQLEEGKGLYLLAVERDDRKMVAKNVELLLSDEEADSLRDALDD